MQTNNRRFGAFSSSVDPQKLSKTVEGVIKIAGGLIAYFGLTSVTGDINSLADQVGQLITLGYTFYGLAESVFGIARRIFVAIHDRFARQ